MKKLAFALLSACLAFPVLAALNPGDGAPEFSARASLNGKEFEFSLREVKRKGPVVVYFYPSAYTHGCNIQAHTFAENIEKFAQAGASVVGVSLDSIARLKVFSADPDYCAGKLTVASDADGKIARAYGLSVREAVAGRKDTRGVEIDHGFAERTTFVVDADGRIVSTIGGISPADNVARALEVVQRLADEKTQRNGKQ